MCALLLNVCMCVRAFKSKQNYKAIYLQRNKLKLVFPGLAQCVMDQLPVSPVLAASGWPERLLTYRLETLFSWEAVLRETCPHPRRELEMDFGLMTSTYSQLFAVTSWDLPRLGS